MNYSKIYQISIQEENKVSSQTEKKTVTTGQGLLMLAVGIAIIIVGILVLKANNAIVLALDGVVMCVMAVIFGTKYNDLQTGIKEVITSMLVAILILFSVGVLVATWMASGTVPMIIYYGMKIISPSLFLPITCLLCTFMSSCCGTSWGTLATVGIACIGIAQGLGVPLGVAAGAICVGAFFGDKISPLSDSPVITSAVSDVRMIDGIKHTLFRTTGPAWIISMVFFIIYGLQFGDGGTVGGEVYDAIMTTIEADFNLNILMLVPVVLVIVLIVMQKPTIPTFMAGIFTAVILAMVFNGFSLSEILSTMADGYTRASGSDVVDEILHRGGFASMDSTVRLLMAAAMFGAPLRVAGVMDILLDLVKKFAKTSRSMAFGVMILHSVLFCITGAYYVTYPVVGGMVKDLYPGYGLSRKNLMRTLLDTGTGLAPMVPWSTTGAYTATTLGVSNGAFTPFAPMLWLSIIFTAIISLTGIGLEKVPEGEEEPGADA